MTTAGFTKKVNISKDGAPGNWKILPVDTPTKNVSATLQENTDLSNNDGFKSRIYGLRDFNIGLDGNFVPYLTYQFNIKATSASTVMSNEDLTLVVGAPDFTYQMNDPTKRIFDREVTPTFKDAGTPIPASDIKSIDYLSGSVTFVTSKTEPVTLDAGSFIPVSTIPEDCISTATLDMSVELEEDTNIKSASNGWKKRVTKLRDVSLSLTTFNDFLKKYITDIKGDKVVLVEIVIGNTDQQTIRGWFTVESDNETGGVADLESEEISLQLDGDIKSSFTWIYPSSGFNDGLKIITDFFFDGGDLHIQLLPDGSLANGFEGQVLLESLSLNMDINGKLTFSSTFQGNGELKDATTP